MEYLLTSGIADHAIQLFGGIAALIIGLKPGLFIKKEEQLEKMGRWKNALVIIGALLIVISLVQIGVKLQAAQ